MRDGRALISRPAYRATPRRARLAYRRARVGAQIPSRARMTTVAGDVSPAVQQLLRPALAVLRLGMLEMPLDGELAEGDTALFVVADLGRQLRIGIGVQIGVGVFPDELLALRRLEEEGEQG